MKKVRQTTLIKRTVLSDLLALENQCKHYLNNNNDGIKIFSE